MGFMESWKEWSLAQWLGWGKDLQNKYDEYRELKTPTWYLNLTDSIWEGLSDKAKDYLNKLVIETCKAFDEAFAKDLLDRIVKAIKEKLGM